MALRFLAPRSTSGRTAGDPLLDLHHEIDRIFQGAFGSFGGWAPWVAGDLTEPPRIDLVETDGELRVSADLPGVQPGDLDVRLEGRTLTLSGERRQERDERRRNYRRVERSHGSFSRSVELPFAPAPDQVRAEFDNGVLTLHVPMQGQAERSHRIEVRADRSGASSASASASTSGTGTSTSTSTSTSTGSGSGGEGEGEGGGGGESGTDRIPGSGLAPGSGGPFSTGSTAGMSPGTGSATGSTGSASGSTDSVAGSTGSAAGSTGSATGSTGSGTTALGADTTAMGAGTRGGAGSTAAPSSTGAPSATTAMAMATDHPTPPSSAAPPAGTPPSRH